MGLSMNVVMVSIVCCIQSVVTSALVKETSPLSPGKFGPSRCHFSNIEACKGPKNANCSIISIDSADNDFTNVTFTLDFKKNAQLLKTCSALKPVLLAFNLHFAHPNNNDRITLFTTIVGMFSYTKIALWTNETLSSPDIVKSIDHPCRHFFLGPLMEKTFNPNANCVVKKGIYATRINAPALLSELLGISFFYGNYRSKTVVLSKDCNIICVRTKFELQRQDSKKPNK